MIHVCVAGITGTTGGCIAEAVKASDDLLLVSGVAPSAAGGEIQGVPVFASLGDALDAVRADVVVDYTTPAMVRSNVLTALQRGASVVVGTSGLGEEELAILDARARETGVGLVYSESFSILTALMQRFALEAERLVERDDGAAPDEIAFVTPGGRLVLRYEAKDGPEQYVAGTLFAIRAVPDRLGLTRGLDSLIA